MEIQRQAPECRLPELQGDGEGTMNRNLIIPIVVGILALLLGGLYGYGWGVGNGKKSVPACVYDLLISDTACGGKVEKYVVTQNTTAKAVLTWDICYYHTSEGTTPMLDPNKVYKV